MYLLTKLKLLSIIDKDIQNLQNNNHWLSIITGIGTNSKEIYAILTLTLLEYS